MPTVIQPEVDVDEADAVRTALAEQVQDQVVHGADGHHGSQPGSTRVDVTDGPAVGGSGRGVDRLPVAILGGLPKVDMP